MKKIWLIAMSLSILFAACTKNEVSKLDNESSEIVGFGSYVGLTKGAPMDNAALKAAGFKAFAAYTIGDDWAVAANSATLNFMYDETVTYSDNWSYENMKYWPDYYNSTDYGKVTFFGYSPISVGEGGAKLLVHSEANAIGTPSFVYANPDCCADQIDLVADMLPDLTKANGLVKFQFEHILSKISFHAKLKQKYDDATVTIKTVTLTYGENAVRSKMKYTYATDNSVQGIWTPTEGDTYHSGSDVVVSSDVVLDNEGAESYQMLNDNDHYMMLIPQSTTEGALNVKIEYEVKSGDGNNASVVNNVYKGVIPSISLLPGRQYQLNYIFELNKVIFDDIQVGEWDDNDYQIDIDGVVAGVEEVVSLKSTTDLTNKANFTITNYDSFEASGNNDFTVTCVGSDLTFAPKSTNSSDQLIENNIVLIVKNILGNTKTYTFKVTQYPAPKLKLGDVAVAITQTIVFKSNKDVASINGVTGTSTSVNYAFANISEDTEISGTLVGNSDFEIIRTIAGGVTISAKNITLETKELTGTIVLTHATSGEVVTYTFTISQRGEAVLKLNDVIVDPSTPQILEFKSTKDIYSVNGTVTNAAKYTIEGADSQYGTLLSISDGFTATLIDGELTITPTGVLTDLGLTDKTFSELTLVLKYGENETKTYTFSATQYAVAYLKGPDNNGSNPDSRLVDNDNRFDFNGDNAMTRTFTLHGNSVSFIGDWVNGEGTSLIWNLRDRIKAPSINGNDITITTGGYVVKGVWRQGYIAFKVTNKVGEETSGKLFVERCNRW